MEDTVKILLSTYNGEKYLPAQLDSIIHQSHKDWELWIRDDGSIDDTLLIIDSYSKADSRIKKFSSEENVGVINSFFTLLKKVQGNYFMFCDQDDVWLNNKIEVTLKKMKESEEKFTPALIYTDLQIVDKDMTLLNDSFYNFQKIDPTKNTLQQLAVQNVVTGCTVMINKSLKEKLCYTSKVVMHDHWLGMIASSLGTIDYLPKATINYRQHENNSVGAKGSSVFSMLHKKNPMIKSLSSIRMSMEQSASFLHCYDKELSKEKKEFLQDYSTIDTLDKINRLKVLRKYQLKKSTKLRTIVFWFLVLFRV